ncbi:hypothetical protein ILUMI_18466, partial [Ignelater luminosus]
MDKTPVKATNENDDLIEMKDMMKRMQGTQDLKKDTEDKNILKESVGDFMKKKMNIEVKIKPDLKTDTRELESFEGKFPIGQEAKVDRFGIIETFQKPANFKIECPVKK